LKRRVTTYDLKTGVDPAQGTSRVLGTPQWKHMPTKLDIMKLILLQSSEKCFEAYLKSLQKLTNRMSQCKADKPTH